MNRRLFLAPAILLTLSAASIAIPPGQAAQTAKSRAASKKPVAAVKPVEPSSPAQVALVSANGVNDIDPTKSLGSKSAPLTVETFSDFQCPACKQLFTTTLQKLIENYVNTGKIYLVHRDFPLPMHAYSRVAASYARAAAHIGKDDVVETALFQNQEKWEATGDVKGTIAAVLSPADMKRVQAIVDSKSLEPLIEKDKSLGQGYGVNQTPTMWLHPRNGQPLPVVGYVKYEDLKSFLDNLVAQK